MRIDEEEGNYKRKALGPSLKHECGGGGEDISKVIIIRNAIIEANKEALVKGIVRSHALHCSGASTSFPKIKRPMPLMCFFSMVWSHTAKVRSEQVVTFEGISKSTLFQPLYS